MYPFAPLTLQCISRVRFFEFTYTLPEFTYTLPDFTYTLSNLTYILSEFAYIWAVRVSVGKNSELSKTVYIVSILVPSCFLLAISKF